MSPAETAMKLAEERKAKAKAAAEAEVSNKAFHEREKQRLYVHLDTRLAEFVPLGFERHGNTLTKDKKRCFSACVEFERAMVKFSDESQEVEVEGYQIRWTAYYLNGNSHEGVNSKVVEFDKELARAMERWL